MITFFILNLLDYITTLVGLSLGLVEANLLLAPLFKVSVVFAGILKMTLCMIVILVLKILKKENLYKILNIIFSIIVISNILLILLNY